MVELPIVDQSIGKDRPLTIYNRKIIEQLLKLDNDLIGFLKQKYQHEAINKEIDKLIIDSKNRKIKTIFVPSLGNPPLYVRKDAGDEEFKKLLKQRKEQFETALKGIKGQITHRVESFDETAMKAYRQLGTYLIKKGFILPEITKSEEK